MNRKPRFPQAMAVVRSREEILVIHLGIRNGRELPSWFARSCVQCLGPRERVTSVDLRTLDRRRTQGFAVSARTNNVPLLGAELVQALVIDREADNTKKGLTHGGQVALLGVDCHGACQDLKGVLRHVWEDVEQRLAITTVIRKQDIGVCGSHEG